MSRNDPLPNLKQDLRRQCLEKRKALGQSAREAASLAICTHIEGWPLFRNANIILTYLPMRGEVDLHPLLRKHPEKHWLIPRILPEQGSRMSLHRYDPAHLIRHPFGMEEPDASLPEVPPEDVQLVLVPGVAYDRQGWRLGYGGGYFDRFLCNFAGISLGVIYQALLLDALPHTEYDWPVDWIVTEEGLFKTRA